MEDASDPAKLAVTGPGAVGAPDAAQSESPVWPRPAHCARTGNQLRPSPATASTGALGRVETAARYRSPATAASGAPVATLADDVAPPLAISSSAALPPPPSHTSALSSHVVPGHGSAPG